MEEESSSFIAAATALHGSFSSFSLCLSLFPPLTCRWRRHVHGGLHPGSNTAPFCRRARPLPVVDVACQDEVDRVFEEDGLERAREVGSLFKLRALGKVGVERAERVFCVYFF